MPVSPLFLGILLPLQPDGVLVMAARVCWQAMMITQHRAWCRREDLRTVVDERHGQTVR